MNQTQLTDTWDGRGKVGSTVVWAQDGQGSDSDFMTIGIDGKPARTFERPVRSTVWKEVTTAPIPAQVSKS